MGKGAMKRCEFIRKMILIEISDDYENVDQQILPAVATDCAKLGLSVTRPDVVRALTELVGDGLAKAYCLRSNLPGPIELTGMPSLGVVETYFETFFYVTESGRAFHKSDQSWWPFDDLRDLRTDIGLKVPVIFE